MSCIINKVEGTDFNKNKLRVIRYLVIFQEYLTSERKMSFKRT